MNAPALLTDEAGPKRFQLTSAPRAFAAASWSAVGATEARESKSGRALCVTPSMLTTARAADGSTETRIDSAARLTTPKTTARSHRVACLTIARLPHLNYVLPGA